MVTLHDNSVIRPDIDLNNIVEVNLKNVFGNYISYLKNKYIREDGTIISKGIFEQSVFKNCHGFEEKLDKYFGKEFFREVIYCLLRDIEYIPRCPICHNYNYLRDWKKGFQKYCSKNCSSRSQADNDEWKKHIRASLKKTYVNPQLDKLGITKYEKDPNDDNYILIYDYCEHHKDTPIRLYFTTLKRLLKNGSGSLCPECNIDLYNSYEPTEYDIRDFRNKCGLFFREFGSVINDEELSMKFFPKERKILDLYFENEVHGKNKEQIQTLKERNYYFENQITEIPLCKYPNCQNKPRYIRTKTYNDYCDCHLNAFHGQSEFEREVVNYIKTIIDTDVVENDRSQCSHSEIDLYLKDLKVGIECNGTFYHTAKRHSMYYHIAKRLNCELEGIRLFSLWSDSWTNKKEVCCAYINRWIKKSKIIETISIGRIMTKNDADNFMHDNMLYDITYQYAYEIMSDNMFVGVFYINEADEYLELIVASQNDYMLNNSAVYYIVEYIKDAFKKDVVMKIDMDVENEENIPSNINYCGMTNDNWRWFKSGLRYPQNAFENYNINERCYQSGVCVYSTDANYRINDSIDKNIILNSNLTREDLFECLNSNFEILEDNSMGIGYSSDYHIKVQSFDLFIDYRCDSPFKRAYIGDRCDLDDLFMLRKVYEDSVIQEWTSNEPSKREYAKENHILYLEIYSCLNEHELIQQIDYLMNAVKQLPVDVSYTKLNEEFEHYKNIRCDKEISEYKINSLNSIIRYFQYEQFYKEELKIYAYDPTVRRKLIQNRCKYLSKIENALTFQELLSGFKKSGIHYGFSHFNPCWTSWFVQKFDIKRIYDPFGGWGHHMLGMLSCDKIIYNDIDTEVCENINRMKDFFKIDILDVHNEDARTFVPDDVDAFFMCPPYMNLEKYSKTYENVREFKNMLNTIFSIWESNSAKVLGIIIREDLITLVDEKYILTETHDIIMGESHFAKNKKRFRERLYIFKKSAESNV